MTKSKIIIIIAILGVQFFVPLFAQNPFIRHLFTADPTARVFGDRVYVYPSHDILCGEIQGRKDWFCMEDYHVFSSSNLTDWTDHGMIVSQTQVDWVDDGSFSMWAPDCVFKNGKYYFYFPSKPKDTTSVKGFTIGVAIADKPEGPYLPQSKPIENVRGIDPNVFIDKDGQAYLYWSEKDIFVAKLKENMLELATEPLIIANLPEKGLKEGPFVFERNGLYYLTYPHVENKTERLEYAIGNSPMGPFTVKGVIMDESPTGCWTNHQSILEFKNQWYLFYHHNDLSPNFDKNRAIRMDSLFFDEAGMIQKVSPTLRGVGLTDATKEIQIDRYSAKSFAGADIDFLDSSNTFAGWKTIFSKQKAWIQYNSTDFGTKEMKSIQVKSLSKTGATLQIRLDKPDGKLISEVKIPKSKDWKTVTAQLLSIPAKAQNLVILLKTSSEVEVDWIKFLK